MVVVVERRNERPGLAGHELATAIRNIVRDVVDEPVAAVLVTPEVPVDIRHNAKIDRALVASWASDVLAGRRAKRLSRRW